ncbi:MULTISPECIES: hypothetical protein [unclassified Crossiella]|uniref:VG15 protein n=1 Tax=unclassified Crossiella TaxID=2620835 RepID=UPI001FFF20DA|nr:MULTISPECIES: hypothetical protein [unclassified Crossiella]MCK2239392.1 hypothetical protein [Crossiella sp. S99.2]MCK2252087.1 hypothetical protein [Crossiella sp. S99.1]
MAGLVIKDVLSVWETLDPLRLDATARTWTARVADQIARHRATSQRLSAQYYQRFRGLEIGRDGWSLPRLTDSPAWRAALLVSLLVTGPVRIKRLTGRGMDPRQAADHAAPAVAAATVRQARAAGRAAMLAYLRSDPRALGYMRVTDGDPCAFCAMLASRGAVYLTKSSALTDKGNPEDGYHDGCGCEAEPVYTTTPALPEASRRFAQLYKKHAEGLPAKQARNAFRRAYEADRRAAT